MQVAMGTVNVHISKLEARVAPTKVVTIPRLELTAVVVSSAVSSMLKEELELKIDQEYFGQRVPKSSYRLHC